MLFRSPDPSTGKPERDRTLRTVFTHDHLGPSTHQQAGLYAGLLVAFCYHLAAGIRHLIWDTGHGLERAQAQRSTWFVVTATVVLVLVFGYCLFVSAGHAS